MTEVYHNLDTFSALTPGEQKRRTSALCGSSRLGRILKGLRYLHADDLRIVAYEIDYLYGVDRGEILARLTADHLTEKEIVRFWAKVRIVEDGCWDWLGAKNQKGYGNVAFRGRSYAAHRISYELANGPITQGNLVLHQCDRPCCVRPSHLKEGTNDENMAERQRKGRQAKGETHGSRTKPWAVTRGDRQAFRAHPEAVPRGERSGMAKISDEIVRDMRHRSRGGETYKDIALRYSLDNSQVSRICRGIAWAHVTDNYSGDDAPIVRE